MKNIIFALIILLPFCSCMTDRKAVDRVLAKPPLKEQVGREWEKANPCANDSIQIIVPGDTLIQTDTVTNIIRDVEFREGQTKVQTVYKTITNTRTIHDTIKVTVVDTRRLNIANDSVNFYKGVIMQRNGQVSALQQEVKDMKHNRNIWKIIAIGLMVGIGGYFTRRLWGPMVGI